MPPKCVLLAAVVFDFHSGVVRLRIERERESPKGVGKTVGVLGVNRPLGEPPAEGRRRWAQRGERGIASVRIRDRDIAYAHPRRSPEVGGNPRCVRGGRSWSSLTSRHS
jgi:hypothetical protein